MWDAGRNSISGCRATGKKGDNRIPVGIAGRRRTVRELRGAEVFNWLSLMIQRPGDKRRSCCLDLCVQYPLQKSLLRCGSVSLCFSIALELSQCSRLTNIRQSFCLSYLVGQSKLCSTSPNKQPQPWCHGGCRVKTQHNTQHHQDILATVKIDQSVKDNFLSWNWLVRMTVGDGMRWIMHQRDGRYSLSWKTTKTQHSIYYTFAFVIVTTIATCATSQQPHFGVFRGWNSGATSRWLPLNRWWIAKNA